MTLTSGEASGTLNGGGDILTTGVAFSGASTSMLAKGKPQPAVTCLTLRK